MEKHAHLSYPELCDVIDPNISGMHFLIALSVNDVTVIVVTDIHNNSLTCLYKEDDELCSNSIRLSCYPCALAKLNESHVIIVISGSREILTVKVNPDLVPVSSLTAPKKYQSLAVINSTTLAAASCKRQGTPSCIDVLNMSGEIIWSVTTHNNEELVRYPAYICVNVNNNIIVSDWITSRIICLSVTGDVLWCRKSHSSFGVTTTGNGEILVAYSSESKVSLLSEDGDFLRDVLTSADGIAAPRAIFYDQGLGRLFLSEDANNIIKEFKFETGKC